jgi:hypothetical protein
VAAHAANNGISSAIVLSAEIEPVPAAPEVHQALFLAAAGAGVLAVFAALYRRATPAPPASDALGVRLDPADPSVRFRWFKVPPSLLALGALGLALLLGMAVFLRTGAR